MLGSSAAGEEKACKTSCRSALLPTSQGTCRCTEGILGMGDKAHNALQWRVYQQHVTSGVFAQGTSSFTGGECIMQGQRCTVPCRHPQTTAAQLLRGTTWARHHAELWGHPSGARARVAGMPALWLHACLQQDDISSNLTDHGAQLQHSP